MKCRLILDKIQPYFRAILAGRLAGSNRSIADDAKGRPPLAKYLAQVFHSQKGAIFLFIKIIPYVHLKIQADKSLAPLTGKA